MPRFLRLWIAYIRIALIRNIEFRAQFITECFIGLLWIALMFTTTQFFFLKTNEIAGWTKQEVYLLIVLWGLAKELFNAFFWTGLGRLAEVVYKGQFDLLLLRPVHPIWQLACSRFDLSNVVSFATHGVLFVILAMNTDVVIHWSMSLIVLILLGLGMVIHFSIHLFLQSLIFWFPNIDNIRYIYHAIADMGQFPTSVFMGIQVLFYSVIPIAYLGTVQTLFLLGKGTLQLFIVTCFVAVSALSISLLLFTIGSKQYSSASS